MTHALAVYTHILIMNEAFQGVEATRNTASKTSDNLHPKHQQPTEIGRKSATVCDRNNSLLIPLFFFFVTLTFVPNQTHNRQSHK